MMRRTLVAATTAAAVALAPVTATAATPANQSSDAQSSQQDAQSSQKGGNTDLGQSSYVKWIRETTDGATENQGFNRFLGVLLDMAIGVGALIVVGGIYGEITKLLPLR